MNQAFGPSLFLYHHNEQFSGPLTDPWFMQWVLKLFQGITNTVGAVPGIVGVALTGFLLDSTHSWTVSC